MGSDDSLIPANLSQQRDRLRGTEGQVPAWSVLFITTAFPNSAQLGSVWQLAVEKIFEGVAIDSA